MSIRRAPMALLAALALLVAAGCSSDDDGPDAAAEVAEPSSGGGESTATEAGSAEPAADEDPENPWVLGYEVDGPAGTTAVIVANLVAAGDEQPPLSATWSITDRPRWQLFTNWVESGELELEVTEGGPATVTAIRARYVDVDDPFAGIEVDERLGSIEVSAGTPATLALP